MKKRFVSIIAAVILCTAIGISALAVVQVAHVSRSLSFAGTTANCSATFTGSGSISATMELWQGNTCVASWFKTGTTVVRFNETHGATSGLSYELRAFGTIGGTYVDSTPVTKTCP